MSQESTPEYHPPFARPRTSLEDLLASKGTLPIRSIDDLAADTFESDEELAEFLRFTRYERHTDVA